MNTLLGDMDTVFESLLLRVSTTPPAGAGVPRVTGNDADCPKATETVVESVRVAGDTTLTLTVRSGMSGRAPTWTMVDPALDPVTGTTAVLPPAGTVTVDGTLATLGLSELMLSVKAVGVGDDNEKVTFSVVPAWTVWLVGPNSVPDARTISLSPVRPYEDTLIIAEPKEIPVTCGWENGVVMPPGI
jgi:hypothetical protein